MSNYKMTKEIVLSLKKEQPKLIEKLTHLLLVSNICGYYALGCPEDEFEGEAGLILDILLSKDRFCAEDVEQAILEVFLRTLDEDFTDEKDKLKTFSKTVFDAMVVILDEAKGQAGKAGEVDRLRR